MLRPSYSELMDILNKAADADNMITSRYSIVIAAAKRARQIIDGVHCDKTGVQTDKAVSIAISEMSKGMIKIVPESPCETDECEDCEIIAKSPSALPKGSARPSYKKSENMLDFGAADDDDDEGYFDDEVIKEEPEAKKGLSREGFGYTGTETDDDDDDDNDKFDDGYSKDDYEDDYEDDYGTDY